MTLRNSIMFLFISALVSACFDTTQNKKFSITTYFTSFANSSNSIGKEKQKFKYSYEEYNADSNLIYQELYATDDNFGEMWGKLFEKTKFFYNGNRKLKAEREFGIAYPPSEIGRGKGECIYTYEYINGQLAKWISDGKPVEEYKYNNRKELVEKRVINVLNVPEYYRYTYDKGVKTKTQYFVADTIIRIDKFLYDTNKKLIEQYSYDSKGEKVGHRVTVRNAKGQAIEENWREPYKGWRMRNDGQIIEDEFYQSKKYYYDSQGRQIKTEFYDIGNLVTVYEFTYD